MAESKVGATSISRGGSQIHRHEAAKVPIAPVDPTVVAATHAAVISHFDQLVGTASRAISDGPRDVTKADHVHLTVHVIAPTDDEPSWTLYTTGLSDRAMHIPVGPAGPSVDDAPSRAELMIRLPARWQLDEASLADPRWGWPVRWLQLLARVPHEYDTWLGPWHSIPNGEPARPLGPGTGFCGVMLLPPLLFDDDEQFVQLEIAGDGEDRIALYGLYPLYAEEMQLKLDAGAGALIDRLAKAEIDDVVDLERANVAL